MQKVFSNSSIHNRRSFTIIFKKRLLLSDVCINSSYDGQRDSLDYVPTAKTSVIRPVYQVSNEVYNHSESTISCLEKKYNFKGRYFYLLGYFFFNIAIHALIFKLLCYISFTFPIKYRTILLNVKQGVDVPARMSWFHLLEMLSIFNQVKSNIF